MPGPKLPEYPKPMFRPDQDPAYARDSKHEDQLASQGWSLTYIPREFPKMLFFPGEKKNCIFQTRAEEDAALDAGWVNDPEAIHYGEDAGPANVPLPGPEPGSPAAAASDPTVAALIAQVAELTKLVTTLAAGQQASATPSPAPKAAPKKKAAAKAKTTVAPADSEAGA